MIFLLFSVTFRVGLVLKKMLSAILPGWTTKKRKRGRWEEREDRNKEEKVSDTFGYFLLIFQIFFCKHRQQKPKEGGGDSFLRTYSLWSPSLKTSNKIQYSTYRGQCCTILFVIPFPPFLPSPHQLQQTETLPQISRCQPNAERSRDDTKEQSSICLEVLVFLTPKFRLFLFRSQNTEKEVCRKQSTSKVGKVQV